ncbi:NUDIX hydrolase 6-like protein [Tanacetum coccineum]|uniref:NUDIX hydrolase 6-like protein n=1 Tax=Tanacetum coccineum TaxID=301880 RepID=A0ABQ4X296_9ASTR
MSKVLQERGFGSLPSSTEANPRDQVKSISTTIEADSYQIHQKKGSYRPQFSKAYSEASHINNSIPIKEKDPRSFTLPCFINNFDNAVVDLGASISVMHLSTYLKLRLGELAHTKLTVELADMNVIYLKGIAENVLVVLKDTDAYRDEGMGDVIFGEPFLKEIGIRARRFKGRITIYNGDDEVSKEDKMNEISHAYQKLKGFYKGVLNLGPDYIRDEKTEEWLTRGHISVHEIEWWKLKKSLT